jgi:hypothetical protein
MEQSNAMSQSQIEIGNLEKAIALGIKLNKPAETIDCLNDRLYNLYLRGAGIQTPANIVHACASSVYAGLGSRPQPSSNAALRIDQNDSPPMVQMTQRPRIQENWDEALDDIKRSFTVIENAGQGDCLFHVLAELWTQYKTFVSRRRSANMSCRQARSYVTSMLRDKASEIILDAVDSVHIGVKEDMEAQKGSVASYCDWMSLDGSPGRCSLSRRFSHCFVVCIQQISQILVNNLINPLLH